MIIDAHTHRYSEEVIADPVAFAVRTGEEKWLSMVSPSDRTTLQGWADRKTMLHDMDAAGVAKCVLLGWYWEKYQTCIEANQLAPYMDGAGSRRFHLLSFGKAGHSRY
jgi:predicted TIM-barrel fold metal-dependent hydrolase